MVWIFVMCGYPFHDDMNQRGIVIKGNIYLCCVRRMLPRCDLAAIYTKPAGLSAVVSEWGSAPFCGRQMDDKWIVFPWDQPDWDNQSTRLIAAFREKIARRTPA
jgi:hypothetical protein